MAGSTYHRESTPSTNKLSQSSETQVLLLEGQRRALLHDVKDAAQTIPLAFIFNLLPTVFSTEVEQVVRALSSGKDPLLTRNGHWSGFPDDPSLSGDTEAVVFAALSPIVNKIFEACKKIRPGEGVDLEYFDSPNSSPGSAQRHTRARPDAHLGRRGKVRSYENSVCVVEVKKDDTRDETSDNISKVVWGEAQLLRDDIRRRFGFGITIEKNHMRVWYTSRSLLVASEWFDFTRDIDTFIRFFMGMRFAEEHQLGWDPTITAVPDSPGQYDIVVHDSDSDTDFTYRITDVLSNVHADSPLGRGTRVYKGLLLVDGQPTGTPVAIKDTWIDSDRLREGEIWAAIRDSLLDNAQLEQFNELFLTVVHHGDVLIPIHDAMIPDDHELILGDNEFPWDAEPFDLMQDEPIDTRPNRKKAQKGQPQLQPAPSAQRIVRGPSTHYRIVYKQVGKALCDLSSVHDIAQSLSETCRAVSLLHRHNWVHRDISASNIVRDAHGQTRLGDLEYALRLDHQGKVHAIRTGTADFMAIEVEAHHYLFGGKLPDTQSGEFGPNQTREGEDEWEDYEDLFQNLSQSTTASQTECKQRLAHFFAYNPIHDYESVWWIGLKFVAHRYPEPSTANPIQSAHHRLQLKAASKVFANRAASFFDGVKILPCSKLQSAMQPFMRALLTMRKGLHTLYSAAEQRVELIDNGVATTLSGIMQIGFGTLVNRYNAADVKLGPWAEVTKAKRITKPTEKRQDSGATQDRERSSKHAKTKQFPVGKRVMAVRRGGAAREQADKPKSKGEAAEPGAKGKKKATKGMNGQGKEANDSRRQTTKARASGSAGSRALAAVDVSSRTAKTRTDVSEGRNGGPSRTRGAYAGKKQAHFRGLSDESDQDQEASKPRAKRVKTTGAFVGVDPRDFKDI